MQDLELLRAKLYFFGFFASFIFLLRFLLQWWGSEKRARSHVCVNFWRLSILGNGVLCLHSIIQVQLAVCLAQSMQLVLAWRNLDLMRNCPKASFQKVLKLLLFSLFCVLGVFFLQAHFLYGSLDWVRTPTLPWAREPAERLDFSWHLFGFLGLFAFSSRFFFQWWSAEKKQKSTLDKSFWWISILGSFLSLCYFLRMSDWVNILGQSASLVPAIRNLQLLAKVKHESL